MGETLQAPAMKAPWRSWGWDLLVFAAVLAVFGRSVGFQFLKWDDHMLVVDQPLLRVDLEALTKIWSGPVLGLYTPLAYTAWTILATLFGKSAWAFHAFNVLLHALCAVLLYRLVRRRTASETQDTRGDAVASVIAALWWSLHPMKVEPVAWVAGMNNLLAGLFSLAALLVMEGGERGGWGEQGGRGWRRWLLATWWYLLALLSKPTALVVLPVAAVLAWTRVSRTPGNWKLAGARMGVWAVIAIVFVKLGSDAQPVHFKDAPGFIGRIVCAVDAIGWYTVSTLAPYDLAIDQARRPSSVLAELNGGAPRELNVAAMLAVGTVVLGLLVAGLVRRWRISVLGIGVFVLALGPVLGFRPFAFQIYSTVAERYAYLASLGPALVLGWAVSRWRRGPHAASVTASAGVVCAALGVWSFIALAPWHDTVSLFKHAAENKPHSVQGQRSMAYLAQAQGRTRDAIALYRKVIQQRPDDVLSLYNVGNLIRPANPGEAIDAYSDALDEATDPNIIAMIHTNRGIAFQQLGKEAEAEQDFRAAIAADANYAPPVSNLAFLLEARGDTIAARELYKRALRLDPNLGPAQRGLNRLGP